MAPDVGHATRVLCLETPRAMGTSSSRDRISVDLRGLKVALLVQASAKGVTPSDFIRAALVRALEGDGGPVAPPAVFASNRGTRVRLSLRMRSQDAALVLERAHAAGLAPGAFVAGLCAEIPVLREGGRPAAHATALVTSAAELSTLARDLRHLTQLLKQGEVRAAQEYRERLERADREVKAHLVVASRAIAELRPARSVHGTAAVPKHQGGSDG